MKSFKGYFSTKKLYDLGLTDRDIVSYCENGKLLKIKKGIYRNANMFINNQNFIDITHAIPKGVISGLSALSFYELSTFIPSVTEIDIPTGYKKPIIFYPTTRIHNANIKKFAKNIRTIRQGRYFFNIYDMEKTLCDCLRLRNTIGLDIAQEALRNYLKHPDKDINKLFRTAKKCRLSISLLTKWLEVLL